MKVFSVSSVPLCENLLLDFSPKALQALIRLGFLENKCTPGWCLRHGGQRLAGP